MKVEISRAAQRDLDAIEAWIAEDNPAAGERMHSRLSKACQTLGRMPTRFTWDDRINAYRRSVGAYLIVYRVGDRVEVMRVLHGARDWLTLLGE